MKKYILLILAILILIATVFYGNYIDKMDAAIVEGYYKQAIPTASNFDFITDRTAKVFDNDGQLTGYIGVGSDIGYGGPLNIVTVVDLQGNIEDVTIINHKETPAYIEKIISKGFFDQFEDKTVKDSLLPLYDIDCVSGATLSTRAIGNSVREVAHSIAVTELNIKPQKAQLDWQLGIAEIAVALLFVAGLVFSRVKKLAKYRLVLLFSSVIILGFWLNRSLSLAQISAMFLGYFPAPQTNLIWYLVLIGAIVPALFTGKNVYCTYICPFCGLQEATHLLSKTDVSIGKYNKWFKHFREIILFIVIFIAFITLNPSKASYEPFGTIFGFNGSKFGWYLLFVVLVASFIFRRFWCKAFCPVGAFLDKIAMINRDIKRMVKSRGKSIKGEKHQQINYKKNSDMCINKSIEKKNKNSIVIIISYVVIAMSIIFVLKSNLF